MFAATTCETEMGSASTRTRAGKTNTGAAAVVLTQNPVPNTTDIERFTA